MFVLEAPKVYLAIDPVDMRKSFDSLYSVALEQLKEDPTEGALFVFTNKRKNRLKMLKVQESGPWVCAKRLETGTFSWPEPSSSDPKISLTKEALHLLLNGIDMRKCCKKAWYENKK